VADLPGDAPLLLYDGTCGFCARSVQFVLRHERRSRTLRFARLEGPTGVALRARRPELAGVDSLVWLEPASSDRAEQVWVRSRGARAVGHYLGGVWRALAALGALVPARVLDAGYDWVARHRRELARDACVLPTPEQRHRFLD
jgi:predicted DCC family thiol-disulfide oxidoreductase YuxK